MSVDLVPELGEAGQVTLDHVYDRPDPVSYFFVHGSLGYLLPDMARPVFFNALKALRARRGRAKIKLLDLGCAYGVNAALLKYGLDMGDLYAIYAPKLVAELGRDTLVARDRTLFSESLWDVAADPNLEVAGLDASEPAVRYALSAGLLDQGIVADLDEGPLSARAAGVVADRDLIISTASLGHGARGDDRSGPHGMGGVSPAGLAHLLRATGAQKPWLVQFVLRTVDFAPFAEVLEAHGYVTETVGRTFPHRRFVSEEEGAAVLRQLARRGVDPGGREANGWHHAEVHLSRPAHETEPGAALILAA